jgi:PAS domain S-box-containing protein
VKIDALGRWGEEETTLFQLLLDQSQEGALLVNMAGEILVANRPACQMLGYSCEELRSLGVAGVVDLQGMSVSGVLEAWRKSGGVTGEIQVVRGDGSRFPAEISARAVREPVGIDYVGIFLRDISQSQEIEERQAELLLMEHEARTAAEAAEQRSAFLEEVARELAGSLDYDTILHRLARLSVPALASACLIYLRGEDGLIHPVAAAHADEEGETLLARMQEVPILPGSPHGVARTVDSGAPLLLLDAEQPLSEHLAVGARQREALAALRIHSAALVPLRARGEVLGAICLLSGGRGWLPLCEDDLAIAARIAQSAALAVDNARLLREAREATQAREEVLSVVAHDLRSPLGAISVSTELLMGPPLEPREQQFHLELIQRAASRMSRLIQDLVDVAKIEAGRLAIEPYLQEAEPLVMETLELFRTRAEAKKVELDYEVAGGMVQVYADRYRFLQLLSNLVENAIKFTPSGGRVRLLVEEEPGTTRITVEDTGTGIAEEDLPHIFDRYWQAENKPGKGAGLGLAIVRGIVEAHGGRIQVESVVGSGTRFSFTVPRRDREPATS